MCALPLFNCKELDFVAARVLHLIIWPFPCRYGCPDICQRRADWRGSDSSPCENSVQSLWRHSLLYALYLPYFGYLYSLPPHSNSAHCHTHMLCYTLSTGTCFRCIWHIQDFSCVLMLLKWIRRSLMHSMMILRVVVFCCPWLLPMFVTFDIHGAFLWRIFFCVPDPCQML